MNDFDRQVETTHPAALTVDVVFKYVFGSTESTGILRSFLSAVQADVGLPPVKEVEIRNPFNLRQHVDDKLSIVDVRAEDAEGKIYTVEIQAQYQAEFPPRGLYYWSRAYASQLRKGDDYKNLNPVIGVNILNFRLLPERPGAHNIQCLDDMRTLHPAVRGEISSPCTTIQSRTGGGATYAVYRFRFA